MEDSLLLRWSEALSSGDDRTALDVGLRIVAEEDAPLAVRLALPGCWQRLRGMDDLDEFVDSLTYTPTTPGIERALLMIATARLHPAALATTEALAPRLLLIAAGLGSMAQNKFEQAKDFFCGCAPRSRMPEPFAILFDTSLARCHEPQAHGAASIAPPQPSSSALAMRIALTLEARCESLLRRGDANAALGLLSIAQRLVEDAEHQRAIQLRRAKLYLLLSDIDAARALLAQLESNWETRIFEIQCALQEDQSSLAGELVNTLPESTERAWLLGVVLATQERWEESILSLSAALEQAPKAEIAAGCHHWIGISSRAQGNLKEAAIQLDQALQIYENALGAKHLQTIDTRVALGATLLELGQQEDATALYEQAYLLLRSALGDEHPRTQFVASGLAELQTLTSAILLEQLLMSKPIEDLQLRHKLQEFPNYIVLINQKNQGLLTMTHDTLNSGAVTFLSRDDADRFVEKLPGSIRMEISYNFLEGGSLGAFLVQQGVDGAVINGTVGVPVALFTKP